jgi:polysaccharide pyruvyl transferase WcaK-like protein/sulfatase maturation enzyme AslB (radical SAM superfamily)
VLAAGLIRGHLAASRHERISRRMNLSAPLGFVQDLRTAFRARPWPLERPTVLQFPVNDICNSGCEMCHIWRQKRDREISPAELARVLDDPLYARVVNVGINGGEPTLRRDLAELVRVSCEKLPRVRRFSLITNALVPKKVIAGIDAIGAVTAAHGKHLDVMLSLDGVGAVHDLVRGRKGNFDGVLRVLEHLRSAPHVDSRQFGYTIVRDNVGGLWETLDFAIRQDTYIKFRLGVPHRRLYTHDLHAPFALDDDERYHVATFLQNLVREYETGAQQLETYRSLIGQLAYHAPRASGCNWQHRGATLTSRGELAYCAVESRALGDAVNGSSSALYFGNTAHLQEIIDTKCAHCAHDYGGISPRGSFLRQAAAQLGLTPKRVRSGRLAPLLGPLARPAYGLRERRLARIAPQSTEPSATRVLLCGWYGTETIGDKAILAGCITALRASFDEAAFDLASLEPFISRHTVRELPELKDLEVLGFEQALAQLGRYRAVVFAGGPVMGVKALADNLALFRAAARMGIERMVLGCGVGPVGRAFYREPIRELLALATLRIFRDEESRALAATLGVDSSQDRVADDPAHTWVHGRLTGSAQVDLDSLVLGLREWPHEQYARSRGGGHAARVRRLHAFDAALGAGLRELLEVEPSTRLVPVPMSTNAAGGDDRWYYRRLFREAGIPAHRIDWRFLEREASPQQILEAFRRAGRILTMRFHSLVFALAVGRPTLAIDYTLGDGKVAALARRSGLPALRLDAFTAAALVERLRTLHEEPISTLPMPRDDIVTALAQSLAARA